MLGCRARGSSLNHLLCSRVECPLPRKVVSIWFWKDVIFNKEPSTHMLVHFEEELTGEVYHRWCFKEQETLLHFLVVMNYN